MERDFSYFKNIVIDECNHTLDRINTDTIEQFIQHILVADQIFFVGVGRVMLSLQAIAKRWAHLGFKTYHVGQITEPAITPNDLLIVASGSGESAFPLIIAKKAKTIGVKLVHIGSNPHSSMKPLTDLFVQIPVQTKLQLPDEIKSQQPMTSLFEQTLLLLGDIIALQMIDRKKLDIHSLWRYHANLE